MAKIFSLIEPAPLLVRMKSRLGYTYMLRLMRAVGWIPPKEGSLRYLYLIWSVIAYFTSIIYFPSALALSFFVEKVPAEKLIGLVNITVNFYGLSVKSSVLLILFSRVAVTRSIFDKMDEHLETDRDRRTIHKAVAAGNYVYLVYFVTYVSYTFLMFSSTLITKEPPWSVYNPFFDWRQGTDLLWLQSFLEFFTMIVGTTICVGVDTLPIITMVIVRGHFEVLKNHIRCLRTDSTKTETENYKALDGCIKYYNLILESCKKMHTVMASIIAIQFIMSGTVLGLTMVALEISEDMISRISSLISLISMLLQTFPFCYLCDNLINDSQELSDFLAQSHWFGAERRYKSTLRIFLQQVQQPITFVGFGIFLISLNTNIKVAKFAFTVVTLVKGLKMFEKFT